VEDLTEIGKRLGMQALAEVATIVKPDAIHAWHRQLIAKKFDDSQHRRAPGRPKIDEEIEALVCTWRKRIAPGASIASPVPCAI